MNKFKLGRRVERGVIASVELALFLFLLVPLVFALAMAFDPRLYVAWFPPEGLTFHWFERFVNDRFFMGGLRTSAFVSVIVTVVSLAIGIPSAFALARHDFRGRDFLNTLVLSPMIAPGVVTGTAIVIMFYGYLHVYAALPGLIVGQTIISIPYVVRTVSASLVGFDRSVEDAARNLGANELQTVWKVTLPIVRPGIVAGAIFAFSTSLGDISIAAFMTDPYTFTLPVAMMNYLRYNFDNTIAAASLLLVFFTAIIVVITERSVGLDKFIGLW